MKQLSRIFFQLLFLMSTSALASGSDRCSKFYLVELKQKPLAPKVAHIVTGPGERKRTDNYYWLRDPFWLERKELSDPNIAHYLRQENDYFEQVTEPLKIFKEEIFKEFKSRVIENEQSVPVKKKTYYYYSRTEPGLEHPIYCRKKNLESQEEVILDPNKLAKEDTYFSLGGLSISQNEELMAFAVDTIGRRFYTIFFKDLKTGKILKEKIENVSNEFHWSADNRSILYAKQDPDDLSYRRIYKFGPRSKGGPILAFEHSSENYYTFPIPTKAKKNDLIYSGDSETSEWRYLDAQGRAQLILPIEKGHLYDVGDHKSDWIISTNKYGKNKSLVKVSKKDPAEKNWEVLIPHDDDTLIVGFEVFEEFIAIKEKHKGLERIRIYNFSSGEDSIIPVDEPIYSIGFGNNPNFKTKKFRFTYNSFTTPSRTIEYDVFSGSQKNLKTQSIPGIDPKEYKAERIWVQSRDGKQIPVSLVYKKELFMKDGSNPLYQYGYGSYGYGMSVGFSQTRFSLLDRGFVYAIAHVRGGNELGRGWYEDGKLLNKRNTFNDFIDVSEHLISEKYTSQKKIWASGGSAGGLLVGAVMNMRPDLYNGVIAAVPFVDVTTTMLDEGIPLTKEEFNEWGNPKVEEFYDYINSYSPIDNVVAQEYPHILITTGLHDSQVQYWEPAKWAAKLRDLKTDDNFLLFKTNMKAGHHASSGRFSRLKEYAEEFAIVLTLQFGEKAGAQ